MRRRSKSKDKPQRWIRQKEADHKKAAVLERFSPDYGSSSEDHAGDASQVPTKARKLETETKNSEGSNSISEDNEDPFPCPRLNKSIILRRKQKNQ
jgi:hypothetical protein